MAEARVKILAWENGGNLAGNLRALRGCGLDVSLFCLFGSPATAEKARQECRALQKSGDIREFEILPLAAQTIEAQANSLLLGKESGGLLFLWSSAIELAPNALPCLAEQISGHEDIAGLNPLLLAGWSGGTRLAHLGTVCDCQKRLHYLYEGIDAHSPLARKRRFFQLAHPGALLMREADFIRAGGFRTGLEHLAFPAFCLALGELRPRGFGSEPDAMGTLHNMFDSWEFCGVWNSILQRGRLNAQGFKTDYPLMADADGLEYRLDPWLGEGAVLEDAAGDVWLAWRRSPNPATLIAFIASLPEADRARAVALARNLPASLPRVFAYYAAQCQKITGVARRLYLPKLVAQARDWQGRSRRFHHGLLKPGMELLRRAGLYDCALDDSPAVFDAWVELGEKKAKLEVGLEWPRIAVLMPVYNPEPAFLKQAVDSVLAQKYGNWQLCIADDASTDADIAEVLRAYAARDERISVKFRQLNGHICRASNTALELADAPWSAFMDQDDMLAQDALGLVAATAAAQPDARYIYSDEDHIDLDNVRRSPIFKPDFDCDLFYTGHLSAYATEMLQAVGGLRPGLEGSQDFDLALRVGERLGPGQILHIPHILYHWRVHENSTSASVGAKPYVLEATKRAWREAGQRKGRPVEVSATGKNNVFRLAYGLPGRSCTAILLADSLAPQPTPELAAWLDKLATKVKLETLRQPLEPDLQGGPEMSPFAGKSPIAACNAAASRAGGEILLFLYAGLRPLAGARPEQLLANAARADIAMAGGLVWHEGRLAHGGLYPNADGLPFALLRGVAPELLRSYAWGQFLQPRHVLGACWQCMAVRREFAAGKFFLDEKFGELALADFSLRHGRCNLHTLITPWAQWESPRQPADGGDNAMFLREWGDAVKNNGLRNANLRAARDNDWTLII